MAERQASAASLAAKDVLAAEAGPAAGMRAAATAAEAEVVQAAGMRAVEVVPEAGVRVAATAAEVVPVVEVARVAGMRAAVTAVEVVPGIGMRVEATAAEAVLVGEVGRAAGMRVEATAVAKVAPAVECIGLLITAEAATDQAGTVAGLGRERYVIISPAGHTFTQAEAAVRSASSPQVRRV